MRAIADKINEECRRSVGLSSQYFIEELKDKTELRKQQQEHYDKFLFFKQLNKAMGKDKEN